MMSYKTLNKGFLCYETSKGTGKYLVIGQILKQVNDRLELSWIFDIDESSCQGLSRYGVSLENNIFIPGIDLDYGYWQRHSKVPYFIRMRVLSPRRLNLEEELAMLGLKHYDEFELLFISRHTDNWVVLRELDGRVLNKNTYLARSELSVS